MIKLPLEPLEPPKHCKERAVWPYGELDCLVKKRSKDKFLAEQDYGEYGILAEAEVHRSLFQKSFRATAYGIRTPMSFLQGSLNMLIFLEKNQNHRMPCGARRLYPNSLVS